MNKELPLELGQKKKINDLYKRGLASQGDYRAVVHICRDKTRKVKAQLELASVVSDNKKRLFQVRQQQEEPKENIRPTFCESGHLTSKADEKTEIFKAFLCLSL